MRSSKVLVWTVALALLVAAGLWQRGGRRRRGPLESPTPATVEEGSPAELSLPPEPTETTRAPVAAPEREVAASPESAASAGGEARVHGKLLLNGDALEMAYGRVHWSGPERSGDEVIREGKFSTSVEAGRVSFGVEIEGLPASVGGTRFSLELEAGASYPHPIELRLPIRPITGRVVLEDGQPVARATIDATVPLRNGGEDYTDRLHVQAESSDDGSFELAVPELAAPFRVEAALDLDLAVLDGVPAGAQGVELVLVRPQLLLVRIRDADDGRLLDAKGFDLRWKRARESVFRLAYPSGLGEGDAEGWNERRLPPGRVDLCARERFGRLGYRDVLLEDVELVRGEPRRIEFTMRRGLDIRLRMAPDQAPFPPGHRVILVEAERWDEVRNKCERHPGYAAGMGNPLRQRIVFFDEQRTLTIRGLAPGRFRFLVQPAAFVVDPAELFVTASSSEPVSLRWSRAP